MRQAMVTHQDHSPITKAAITVNRIMVAAMVMGITGTMTDRHLIFAYAKMPMNRVYT